ncbi:MAG TPA: glutamate--tRNA ligase [Candidatus Paceibacterota bacterium]|jgi:glutamyl-tRNA synthetase|nr:glutamate--tRNA ligase [Candidatus Paceibacterota bacterium]
MTSESSPKPIVTRFAPSPTGMMHIGGVRTALFAYLLARKNKGTFILRIEDTDKEREVAGSIQHIQDSLSWLGIEWDFGPTKPGPFGSCIQSERLDIYKKYALELIAKGLAYPDPYTAEELATFRAEADMAKKPFLYRNHRPSEELMKAPWDGTKPLRLKTPTIGRSHWHDAVRGDLQAGEEAQDDFIIIKSDGYPTYNFAHIIDDHEMGVTHILRGEEFISSTPKYISLYEALGFTPPIFATLPPILRDDKTKKLGKRDGAKDILEYKKEGYLPEAMTNILALIGWNPGTEQEVFTMDDLKSVFDISKVQKSGGVFNEDKLAWFNREHIARLSDDQLIDRLKTFLTPDQKKLITHRTLPLVKEKIVTLGDAPKLFDGEGELSFIHDISDYPADQLLWKKNPDKEIAKKHLREIHVQLQTISDDSFTPENIKNTVWAYVEAHGKGDVLWPFRVAVTGKEKSPDPFMSSYILGKTEALKRIDMAVAKLA